MALEFYGCAVMRYRRLRVAGGSYFFTVVTHERKPIFSDREPVELLCRCIEKVRARHPFDLIAQVVMPDHVHALWTMPKGNSDFSLRWRLIKEAFTRGYMQSYRLLDLPPDRELRGERAVWQRRFWEHLIRDQRDFSRHLDYIHLNPVHHGYATSPREWPYSTFADWVSRGTYEPNWGSNEKPQIPDWAERHE